MKRYLGAVVHIVWRCAGKFAKAPHSRFSRSLVGPPATPCDSVEYTAQAHRSSSSFRRVIRSERSSLSGAVAGSGPPFASRTFSSNSFPWGYQIHNFWLNQSVIGEAVC